MGITLLVQVALGLIKAIPQLISKIPQIISALVSGLKSGAGSLASVGSNLVSGIWSGISNSLGWIKSKISGWVGNVTSFIKRLFGINSPSRLFRDEIGTNLALGLGEGFGDTMHDVSQDMADAIPTEFDADIHTTGAVSSASTYDVMVSAFKQALTEVKVEMNGREMGTFVENTMERVVYA
jgi:phage-related protein